MDNIAIIFLQVGTLQIPWKAASLHYLGSNKASCWILMMRMTFTTIKPASVNGNMKIMGTEKVHKAGHAQ